MDAPSGGLAAGGGVRVGCRVGVRRLPWAPEGERGAVDTVIRSYGHPDCAAYDVLLDGDAGPRLFWYHQLEEVS